jgi:N utilization substance protein B
MSNRRTARHRALQALYAQELSGDSAKHIIANIIEPDLQKATLALRFSEKLFLRTVDNAERADALIEQYTRNWELSRIALVDRLVLRMAITEMLDFEDIPPKVTINEAIETAKRFSTDKSGVFVNGVLDAILIDLHQQGKIKKSGRGLVGMDSVQRRSAKASSAS